MDFEYGAGLTLRYFDLDYGLAWDRKQRVE